MESFLIKTGFTFICIFCWLPKSHLNQIKRHCDSDNTIFSALTNATSFSFPSTIRGFVYFFGKDCAYLFSPTVGINYAIELDDGCLLNNSLTNVTAAWREQWSPSEKRLYVAQDDKVWTFNKERKFVAVNGTSSLVPFLKDSVNVKLRAAEVIDEGLSEGSENIAELVVFITIDNAIRWCKRKVEKSEERVCFEHNDVPQIWQKHVKFYNESIKVINFIDSVVNFGGNYFFFNSTHYCEFDQNVTTPSCSPKPNLQFLKCTGLASSTFIRLLSLAFNYGSFIILFVLFSSIIIFICSQLCFLCGHRFGSRKVEFTDDEN